MVNAGQQLRMRRHVERMFAKSCGRRVAAYEQELKKLGFVQTGGDPFALRFENGPFDLFLELMLDPQQCVHTYQVMTFAERDARQQKFRW